jgi:hypothetical protein
MGKSLVYVIRFKIDKEKISLLCDKLKGSKYEFNQSQLLRDLIDTVLYQDVQATVNYVNSIKFFGEKR